MKKQKENNVVPFTKEGVKEYLNTCICFWRKSKEPYAKYYVDAFQSVRISIFGKVLEQGEIDEKS